MAAVACKVLWMLCRQACWGVVPLVCVSITRQDNTSPPVPMLLQPAAYSKPASSTGIWAATRSAVAYRPCTFLLTCMALEALIAP